MSTGYGWEGIRQVSATLLGARHVPKRLCGGWQCLLRGAIQVIDLYLRQLGHLVKLHIQVPMRPRFTNNLRMNVGYLGKFLRKFRNPL